MIDIIKLRVRTGENGDDLVGVIEGASAALCVPEECLTVRSTAPAKPCRLGTVQAGGCAVDLYGNDTALRAARRLRRATIEGVATAIERADRVLGYTHPMARYLDTLREGCGPAAYHSRPAREYESAARQGCDLRRDMD